MSLLGAQVYANPDTPCWVSASGDTINGDLTVNGNISATGSITAGPLGVIAPDDGNGFSVFSGATLKSRFQHIAGGARTLLQSSDPLYFTQVGQANGNTNLQTSAPLANADVLTVGGTVNTGTLGALRLSLATGAAGIVGTGQIPVGATNVVIPTTAVTGSSKIFVTHSGPAAAGPGNGAAQGGLTVNGALITPGVSFRVDLVDPATGIAVAASLVDVPFNWLIIG